MAGLLVGWLVGWLVVPIRTNVLFTCLLIKLEVSNLPRSKPVAAAGC